MSTKEKVIKTIVAILGSGNVVNEETVVINASGITEHITRTIIMELEEAFEISIPEEEAEKFSTVKSIIDYVETKIKKEV